MSYSPIPGNDKLKISLKGDIQPVFRSDIEEYEKWFTIDDKKITLKMYGENRYVSLFWLATIAHYRLVLPKGYEQLIFRYRFKKCSQKKHMNKDGEYDDVQKIPYAVVFSEPVYFTKEYRIIPEFPGYAVSENKKFINVKTGQEVKAKEVDPEGNKRYPAISLYHNYFGKSVSRSAHVIVATTWIDNDDYEAKPLVNHKDGDKSNYAVYNLEWSSYSENLIHAYENGLRTDNHPVKVYDKLENKISLFHSVTEAFKSFDSVPRPNLEHLFKERNGFYIAKNRYEIRYMSDKNDFLLQKISVEEALKLTASTFKRNRTYEAINTKTDESFIGSNGVIQKALGISESAVTSICRKKTYYNDWIIRDNPDEPLDLSQYKQVANKKVSIVRTNVSTGSESVYNSLREAGRENNKIDPITVKRLIASGDIYQGFKFKYA